MEQFDRVVARWSAIVGLISGAGIVVAYAAGAISQIKHFPWYAKWPLIFFVALLALVIVARSIVAFRHRKDAKPIPGSISQTLVRAEGASIQDFSVGSNVMTITTGATPPMRRLRRIRLSAERQAALAAKGRELAQRIAAFAVERRLSEVPHSFPPRHLSPQQQEQFSRARDEQRDCHRAETEARYRSDYMGAIGEYLDEIREAGLDTDQAFQYQHLAGGAPIAEIAEGVRVQAARVERYRPTWWVRLYRHLRGQGQDSTVSGEPTREPGEDG